MNFGGGPFQNGPYQNVPLFNPIAPGVQPPPTGVPVYPAMPIMPMPSVHPGMMPAAPLQTSYPEGQGPLAGRPVQRGSNGLLQAPEPDGPEQHEALQYIKLNPAEELKYNEYWTQACEGEETVAGAQAVEFLSRAAKVSKGQLRRIWDIADHRKEGALDQKQFFIALRLLALAQRGAELSVAGLRNFTGIQLIPSIDPPPKQEPEKPEEPASAPEQQKPLFSWTITAEVAARYDSFFRNLDTRNAGFIDGKQGVTFFGKSGLPRPTLKRIWGLADVTKDGLLSLDEFRTAMHMVTCIRNKRLTVTALPNELDPNGTNWLRVAGADPPTQDAPSQPIAAPSAPAPASPRVAPQPPQTQPGQDAPNEHPLPAVIAPGPPSPQVSSATQQSPVVSVPPPLADSQLSSQAQAAMQPPQQQVPLQYSVPESTAMSVAAREAEQARKEAESIREALRQEKLEFERARREMQEMRAEMERLRIEKQSFATLPSQTTSTRTLASALPPSYGQDATPPAAIAEPTSKSLPPAPAPLTNPPTGSSVTQASVESSSGHSSAAPPPRLATSANKPHTSAHISSESQVHSSQEQPALSTRNPPPVQSADTNRDKRIEVGADDDDIWDQPSPKASALPGPSNLPGIGGTNGQSEDGTSSDDDDDFWGGAMAPKPTLGPAGGQKAGQNESKGFGGSELDDWVF